MECLNLTENLPSQYSRNYRSVLNLGMIPLRSTFGQFGYPNSSSFAQPQVYQASKAEHKPFFDFLIHLYLIRLIPSQTVKQMFRNVQPIGHVP
jgi:hypothetical protein